MGTRVQLYYVADVATFHSSSELSPMFEEVSVRVECSPWCRLFFEWATIVLHRGIQEYIQNRGQVLNVYNVHEYSYQMLIAGGSRAKCLYIFCLYYSTSPLDQYSLERAVTGLVTSMAAATCKLREAKSL